MLLDFWTYHTQIKLGTGGVPFTQVQPVLLCLHSDNCVESQFKDILIQDDGCCLKIVYVFVNSNDCKTILLNI